MLKFYYVNHETKTISVFDTKPEAIDADFLGESTYPNIKAQAAMLLRGKVGYRILSNPVPAT